VIGPCYVHMLENLGPELACHPVTEEMFLQPDRLQATPQQDSWQL